MLSSFKSWWNSPYQENMSAWRWFLFVGFLILVGVIWQMAIRAMAD